MTDPLVSSRCARATAVVSLCLGLGLVWPCMAAQAQPGARVSDPAVEISRLARAGPPAAALARLDGLPPEQAREPRWRFLRGVLLAELGRVDEAAAEYTALTQEFPELADPYNNLAVLRAAQGRLDEARVALETALRVDPVHAEARENLGDVYVRLAVRLWEGLISGTGSRPPDPQLSRKLRLARDIGTPAR